MTIEVTTRPHESRRRHQNALGRARRRRRHRRQVRIRRIRLWKALRSARFWGRTTSVLVTVLSLTFWAKFAFVYDIPGYAERGTLSDVQMYVTVKPWWFGPPVFDVANFGPGPHHMVDNTTAYSMLLDKLGKYEDVLLHPSFVWMSKT